jgi:hypothetical protein
MPSPNQNNKARGDLEAAHGDVWNQRELENEFEVIYCLAPYFLVRRKKDKQLGRLTFQPSPRFYFNFEPGAAPDDSPDKQEDHTCSTE